MTDYIIDSTVTVSNLITFRLFKIFLPTNKTCLLRNT